MLTVAFTVSYVKNNKTIAGLQQHLLEIKADISFTQTYRKIRHHKQADYIYVTKPQTPQMAAVLLNKLIGKKFFWVQNFANPPSPGFLSRLLLSQADKIIVNSKRDF